MSSDIVYQYTGKQGGFLASSGYLKMLHFKIVWGLRLWDPTRTLNALDLLRGGGFPYPTFGMIKHNGKIPLKLPEGHKSLQANLRLEKFVQVIQQTRALFSSLLSTKSVHPEEFLLYYPKNFEVPPGVLQRGVTMKLGKDILWVEIFA